jgi:hypothetical protein
MLTIVSILVIIIIAGSIGLVRFLQPTQRQAYQPVRIQRAPLSVTIKRG